MPVFHVTGAFGSGKSTVASLLAKQLPECFVLDCDWLMEPLVELSGIDLFNQSESWPALHNVWFTIAETNTRAGRSTVFFSPAEPSEIEASRLRTEVDPLHWMLLDCSDDELVARLERRGWEEQQITESLSDAAHLRTLQLPIIDTGRLTPEEVASQVEGWIRGLLT